MNDTQIIRKYEKAGTWIGAVVLSVVFLIVSCLAPIDGVPGYKLITQEDFSIIFGFALAVLVGAGLGAVGGARLGIKYGKQKVAQSYQSVTPSRPASATPRPYTAATNDHPLLDQLLSKMPPETHQKVGAAFASVSANFEFYTWVSMSQTRSIADEANRRGFTIWGNTDATSAILYGAGVVSEDQLASVIVWLRAITEPGTGVKGLALVTHPGANPRLIEFDSASN